MTRMLTILTILAVLTGAATLPSAAPANAATACLHAAHRGNHEQRGVTENGMPAIRAAKGTFEVDVRTIKSGALVLMHDLTVDRTTTGTGRVRQMTAPQIRGLRLDDGSKVPFVARVFRHLRAHPRKHAILHVKAVPGSRLVDAARRNGVLRQVSFMSRNRRHLDVVPRHVRTVVLAFRPVEPRRWERYDVLNVEQSAVRAGHVRRARSAGLRYWALTANTRAQWRRLTARGVGRIMTDRPGAFAAWCARQ